jgi:hypothetical protein
MDFSMHENVYLNYIIPFLDNCWKKNTDPHKRYSSNMLFKPIEHVDIVEESSITQHGCTCTQSHMLYFDHWSSIDLKYDFIFIFSLT